MVGKSASVVVSLVGMVDDAYFPGDESEHLTVMSPSAAVAVKEMNMSPFLKEGSWEMGV